MANNVLRGLDAGLARASRQLKRVTRRASKRKLRSRFGTESLRAAMGQSLPTHSAPVPPFVRCYSNSDQIVAVPRMSALCQEQTFRRFSRSHKMGNKCTAEALS